MCPYPRNPPLALSAFLRNRVPPPGSLGRKQQVDPVPGLPEDKVKPGLSDTCDQLQFSDT